MCQLPRVGVQGHMSHCVLLRMVHTTKCFLVSGTELSKIKAAKENALKCRISIKDGA